MARRDEEKKRRRQKRLQKRHERGVEREGPEPGPPELRMLESLLDQIDVAGPVTFPGACHPVLGRPDLLKAEMGMAVTNEGPGPGLLHKLTGDLDRGLIGFLPELHSWAIEEFVYHGVPGNPWRPIEAFLEKSGDRFPPEAREQVRLWGQARIGIYVVGEVADDLVTLQEWSPGPQGLGPPFRAVALNIGGVNAYRQKRGVALLTYVAPWRPEEVLFCVMGYGLEGRQGNLAPFLPYLGLRHPEVVARPLPWKEGRAAEREWLRLWRQRDWQGWLEERLQFPFQALVGVGPNRLELLDVQGLIPSTPEKARSFGIYFHVARDRGQEALAAGGTTVTPLDVTSVNRMALAEYHAYRELAGPPPGTIGMAPYTRLR